MSKQNIVIVGAGIVGLSTAYALLKQGTCSVTVLEEAHVDHPRSTSHGISRLLRYEYGDKFIYSRMVQLSLQRWLALEAISQKRLYSLTGLLMLGSADDNFTTTSYETLHTMNLPISKLSQRECEERFPQFNTKGYDAFSFNQQGGVLHASTGLQVLRDLILDRGGHIVERSHVKHIKYGNLAQPLQIRLSSDEIYNADRVILAAGPWIRELVRDVELPVHITRQYLLYFANLPHGLFRAGIFPPFLARELYGFPIHSTLNGGGPQLFKAASHQFGVPVEPGENTPLEDLYINQTVKKLRGLLPALEDAQLVKVDSCVYDVTPDEDFILDTLPNDHRVTIATGLSGHGYKFGPLLGEIVSSIVLDEEPPVTVEPFKLSRFTNAKNTSMKEPISVM